MKNILQRILKSFIWSDWESVGQQLDEFSRKRFEVFKKVNGNGLSKYKKVKIVGATCYYQDARVQQLGSNIKPNEKLL